MIKTCYENYYEDLGMRQQDFILDDNDNEWQQLFKKEA